jgi:hypothetical protein
MTLIVRFEGASTILSIKYINSLTRVSHKLDKSHDSSTNILLSGQSEEQPVPKGLRKTQRMLCLLSFLYLFLFLVSCFAITFAFEGVVRSINIKLHKYNIGAGSGCSNLLNVIIEEDADKNRRKRKKVDNYTRK